MTSKEPKGGDRKEWGCGAIKAIEDKDRALRPGPQTHYCRRAKGHSAVETHKCACGHAW